MALGGMAPSDIAQRFNRGMRSFVFAACKTVAILNEMGMISLHEDKKNAPDNSKKTGAAESTDATVSTSPTILPDEDQQ